MALTTSQKNALTRGDKLVVPSFEVTVLNPDGYGNTVEVTDSNGYNYYIYKAQLIKPVPYVNGQVYASTFNDLYRYIAGAGGEPGKWQALEKDGKTEVEGSLPERFNYPSRPMKLVTFGEELSD